MNDYKSKLCPFLSGAVVAAQIANKVNPEDREAVSCQGPSCALFMTVLDESGKTAIGGNCSITLAVNALSHINVNVAKGMDVVAPNRNSLIAKG